MKKTLLECYALAVCFFAVACLVVTIGIALYDVVQIAAPGFTLGRYAYQNLQSNEAYRSTPVLPGGIDADRKTMTDGDLTVHRHAALAQAMDLERRDGQQSFLRMVIVAIVAAVTFAIHWSIARRARNLEA